MLSVVPANRKWNNETLRTRSRVLTSSKLFAKIHWGRIYMHRPRLAGSALASLSVRVGGDGGRFKFQRAGAPGVRTTRVRWPCGARGRGCGEQVPYTVGFLVESQCMWVRVGGGLAWLCVWGARRHNNSTSWGQQQHLVERSKLR